MNAVVFHISLLLILSHLDLFIKFTFAGTCWSTMVRRNNGRCKELLYERISKEDCCSSSTSIATAWSAEELDPSTLFFWRMFGGGVRCLLCKESCQNVECEPGKSCVVRKGTPKCVCSSCKEGKKKPKGPVCGTDGRTYRNWCRMKKKSCKQRLRNLSVAYYGVCQSSCDKISCPDSKTCLLDQNLTPHCIHCSKKTCPAVPKQRQVCGSDGLTYKSACHLREVACLKGRAIPIAYKGFCRDNVTCHNIHCQDRQQCLLDMEAGGRPRCVACSISCRPKLLHGPVCGTNNSTYQTWCHMMQDACSKGYVIDTKHSGKCILKNDIRP
ncbi:follistatin isoform X2 [Dendroctonus ponderosae]|uniref:Follistatin n=2 Tax=Dendroctonus ponderosae TaxID=77166 RepID=A0AAR5Q9V4_DENPD|nr:follistatin isoform X2 [Dendroctonus ponderosae]